MPNMNQDFGELLGFGMPEEYTYGSGDQTSVQMQQDASLKLDHIEKYGQQVLPEAHQDFGLNQQYGQDYSQQAPQEGQQDISLLQDYVQEPTQQISEEVQGLDGLEFDIGSFIPREDFDEDWDHFLAMNNEGSMQGQQGFEQSGLPALQNANAGLAGNSIPVDRAHMVECGKYKCDQEGCEESFRTKKWLTYHQNK